MMLTLKPASPDDPGVAGVDGVADADGVAEADAEGISIEGTGAVDSTGAVVAAGKPSKISGFASPVTTTWPMAPLSNARARAWSTRTIVCGTWAKISTTVPPPAGTRVV